MDAPVKALNTEKAKALQAALAQIEKQFGKGSIMRLGEGEKIEDIQVVSTGSLGLDIALGVGGLKMKIHRAAIAQRHEEDLDTDQHQDDTTEDPHVPADAGLRPCRRCRPEEAAPDTVPKM